MVSPEAVGTDAPDEGHVAAEAREADRHVRLGAGDEPAERDGFRQRPRFVGDERDQALPERDDARHACELGRARPGVLPRASATAAVTCAARDRMPAGSPSPISQPPIPTATAPP